MPTRPGIRLLGVDEDGREGRGEDQPDDHAQDRRPEQADIGQRRVNGSTPRIDHQITRRVPIRSPIGPPITVPAATATEEQEQVELRALHRQPERMDQVEGVETA